MHCRPLGIARAKNLIVERRFASGDDGRLPALATDLVLEKVDIIVTQSSTATLAAKRATMSIPIVMGSIADAIGSGLVASLSHPGGNVTGTSFLGSEWAVKHVQLILELRPGAKRLAFLANFQFLPEAGMYRAMEAAAAGQGVEMSLYNVHRIEDYEPAFESMVRGRVEGLLVAPNAVHRERRRQLAALAIRYRMPTIYGSRDMVEDGGLMSYGVDFPDLWRKAADYVDKIFKGAKPGDLPIQQPTKFELVINLKTAKTIGIEVPATILARADEVIE